MLTVLHSYILFPLYNPFLKNSLPTKKLSYKLASEGDREGDTIIFWWAVLTLLIPFF